MKLKNKLLILGLIIIFFSLITVYASVSNENTYNHPVISNETDTTGCCSIVLQMEGNNSIMTYRRDANSTADVYIKQINWHGKDAIKQYKTDGGYFNHVILTNDGWVIGFGGIDDGEDSKKCEEIAAKMINNNSSISKDGLKQIQDIKQLYKKGHFVIKAPNGNYGFATPTKLKTGKLVPGQYISIPNHYNYSRGGHLSLNTTDKVKAMTELSLTDAYGLNRREVVTYVFNTSENANTADLYIANDDGSNFGMSCADEIDDVYINNTLIKGSDIPIAPQYKYIGSYSFSNDDSISAKLTFLIFITGFVIFVGVLSFASYKFVRYMKYKR